MGVDTMFGTSIPRIATFRNWRTDVVRFGEVPAALSGGL